MVQDFFFFFLNFITFPSYNSQVLSKFFQGIGDCNNNDMKDESGVSPVSKRYMRAGIGNERLLVCLSEYLPLHIVYRISSMSTIE